MAMGVDGDYEVMKAMMVAVVLLLLLIFNFRLNKLGLW